MSIQNLAATVSNKLAPHILSTKKHSPTILFGVGVVGFVATTVLAARATLNAQDALVDAREKLEMTDEALGLKSDKYTDEMYTRDRIVVYTQTTLKMLKIYALPIVVGGLSLIALTGSHHILKERNLALTTAYTALDQAYRQYRERVRGVIGEDEERELYRHVEHVGEEDGRKIVDLPIGGGSIYARMFDQDCGSVWSPNPDYNFVFLRAQQNYMNDRLHLKGHLFLNEVYDALGMPRTPAGQMVGWVRNPEVGDGYVDFGIFMGVNGDLLDMIHGRSNSVLLDFNVDGVIYDLI